VLFGFRGIRVFQIFLALVTLACGVGATVLLKAFTDGASFVALIGAILLAAVFLWTFGAALRAPTSFVAISPERTRIRFAGFVDTVIDNRDVVGARLVRHRPWAGVGVRTNFQGDVALVTAWGEVAELVLNRPIRIWLIPKLVPLRASRLRLSVRHPEKLVERFGAPPASPDAGGARKMKARRRR
jgi:hypothetical protein